MSFGAQQPTQALSVTGSSGGVAIPVGAMSCRVANTSTTVTVFVVFGVGETTAAIPAAGTPANGIPVLPGQTAVLDVPKGANYVAAIGSAAGPTLTYFTFGAES